MRMFLVSSTQAALWNTLSPSTVLYLLVCQHEADCLYTALERADPTYTRPHDWDGRAALTVELERGLTERLVALKVAGKAPPPRAHYPLFAGGRSMGGRIASMAAAEGMPTVGLIFLAYPLHPPGRPDRMRDEHLYGITAPMLFIQGTRDAFAQPHLLLSVLERLGSRAELVEIEGADHGFRRAGGERDATRIGAALAEPAAGFVERVIGAR